MNTDTWDIATDLPFLIARDDQLKDDLAIVCELLSPGDDVTDSTSDAATEGGDSTTADDSDTSAPPTLLAKPTTKRKVSCAPPGARNQYQFRQKQEIQLLQSQVETLQAQLAEAHAAAAEKMDLPKWERAARVELQAKLRSLGENEKLKADIATQSTFLGEMEKYFRKKPRLTMETDVQSEEWQSYKLAAQASLRVAAIHAIADRQYRRMDTAFINAGLIGVTTNLFRYKPIRQPHNKVLVELVNHVTLAAPFHTVGLCAWHTFHLPHTSATSSTSIEVVDPNTIYEQCTETKHGVECHSNTICKLYTEPKRDVIVWRTVLEDDLAPHMLKGAVDDQWGWIVLTPLDNPNQCRLTLLLQVLADASAEAPPQFRLDASVDSITSGLELVSCSATPGSFPRERQEVTEGLPPALLTFMERGRRMEHRLRRAIDRAIRDFNHATTVPAETPPQT
ncbi:hypothetical protein H310_04220 [Aphanomyces invadans]|uniref:START domain-containing protein n=1 Tax=Aphanomyces invadans TaxID=157072 RepID=A0A024UGB5_9STRA|nr:hypothetical protein H310_04220 [Aphanomyces invadans]ETW05255.1 hypothetical protein H310_04220 [Aphanomyces invadans]|eukprot:XP_008866693.1 hypothetical protein H310_04220 [Aphanomyces invadans]